MLQDRYAITAPIVEREEFGEVFGKKHGNLASLPISRFRVFACTSPGNQGLATTYCM